MRLLKFALTDLGEHQVFLGLGLLRRNLVEVRLPFFGQVLLVLEVGRLGRLVLDLADVWEEALWEVAGPHRVFERFRELEQQVVQLLGDLLLLI